MTESQMFREAAQAAATARAQLACNDAAVRALAERLRGAPPRAVVTVARGSSDNAATYGRYLIETRLEILTASAAPSISSVYAARPAMAGALCVVISQSGRSPDIISAAESANRAGALVVALVNDETSPLAAAADVVIPLCAAPERSVAATKSYIGALIAIAHLTAHWAQDEALLAALEDLPEALERAWALNWSAALPVLADAQHLYVLGRGPGFAIAQEAALKFKETCGLHAEAFSAAEVRHGPMTLAGPDFPVMAFVQDDEGRESIESTLATLHGRGAPAIQAGGVASNGVTLLPTAAAHPVLTPIVQIQTFYKLANALALARGFDPDHPAHLAKVTATV